MRYTWCDLLYFYSREVSHEKEKQGVGRDVEIEIDETMDEKTTGSHQTRELQGAGEGMTALAQSHEGLAQQNAQKPDTT